jgi:hypothetical protein
MEGRWIERERKTEREREREREKEREKERERERERTKLCLQAAVIKPGPTALMPHWPPLFRGTLSFSQATWVCSHPHNADATTHTSQQHTHTRPG